MLNLISPYHTVQLAAVTTSTEAIFLKVLKEQNTNHVLNLNKNCLFISACLIKGKHAGIQRTRKSS